MADPREGRLPDESHVCKFPPKSPQASLLEDDINNSPSHAAQETAQAATISRASPIQALQPVQAISSSRVIQANDPSEGSYLASGFAEWAEQYRATDFRGTSPPPRPPLPPVFQASRGNPTPSSSDRAGVSSVPTQCPPSDEDIDSSMSDDGELGLEGYDSEQENELLFGKDQEILTENIDSPSTHTVQAPAHVASGVAPPSQPPLPYFSPQLSSSHMKAAVDKFSEFTQASSEVAEKYLEMMNGNCEQAIQLFCDHTAESFPRINAPGTSSTHPAFSSTARQAGADPKSYNTEDTDTPIRSLDSSSVRVHPKLTSPISSNAALATVPVVATTSRAGVKRTRDGKSVASKQPDKANPSVRQYFTPLNQPEDEAASEEVAAKKQKTATGKPIATSAKPKAKKTRKPAQKVFIEKEDVEVNYGALEEEDTSKAYKPLPEEKLTKRELNFKPTPGTAGDTPPISTTDEMFAHMGSKAEVKGLFRVLSRLSESLRVATLCSGTDSPILGLEMVFSWFLQTYGENFKLDHAMSAELVPQKQRFIMRNFKPDILLRDVMDLLRANFGKALTVYGNEVDVPTNIDVCVCGFSCVDFSGLNFNKKALDEGGESGDTFNASRTYANHTRPKLLVLENVSGAPWLHKDLKSQAKNFGKKGIDKQLEEIGYAVGFLKLDTKDYYIPHTRVRGYMIGTDIQAWYNLHHGTAYSKKPWTDWLREVADDLKGGMKELEEQVEELRGFLAVYLHEWADLVKYFRSPANVPVEQMLIEEDSYLLSSLRSDKREKNRKPTAWKACQVGHDKYRDDLGVGRKRMLTEWVSGGSYKLPDFYDPALNLVERVLDTMEIAHNRSVQRGYDDREYCRVLELSQNVYRVEDMTQNGIIGCLMPNGYPWSTIRGRRINGIEALRLQGLPVEKLDLAGQTQADLQDLAGNAMTSTVVCAVTISALITFEEILEKKVATEIEHGEHGEVMEVEETPLENSEKEDRNRLSSTEIALNYGSKNAADYAPMSVASVTGLAAQTVRLCIVFCSKDNKVNFQCKNCGYTVCKSHFGKPKHNYEVCQPKFADITAFSNMIKNALPRVWIFKINGGGDDWFSLLDHHLGMQEDYYDYMTVERIKKEIVVALKSPLWIQSTKRVGRTWVVRYESQQAILVCTISATSVEWLFFLNGTKKPWNDDIGKQMRNFPILRMKPTDLDLTHGDWEFWLPRVYDVSATVTSGGSLVESYANRLGIKRFNRDLVATEVTLKLNKDSDKSYFESNIEGLYRLHQECGQAFDTLHVLEDGSKRKVFLFLDHEFREGDPKDHPFVITFDTSKLASREPRQNVIGRLKNPPNPQNPDQVSYWRQPISLASEEVREGTLALTSCQQLKIETKGRWSNPIPISFDDTCIQRIKYGHLPRTFAFGSQHACTHKQTVFHAQTKLPVGFDPSWIMEQSFEITNSAAPVLLGKLKWVVDRVLENVDYRVSVGSWMDQTAGDLDICNNCSPVAPHFQWTIRKIKGKAKLKIAPLEDWRETNDFELKIKQQPKGLVAKLQVQRSGEVNIKIEANPTTLMHQAKSLLAKFGGPETIKTSWRIISNDMQSKSLNLAPLTIKDVSAGDVSYKLPSHAGEYLKVELFDCQLRALKWLAERENNPPNFLEEEIVEERVDQLNHSGWGRAEREITRSGSLAAFDVGFGKTILTLALMAAQRPVDEQWAQTPLDGAIPIKATMVFVPTQLTLQWSEEVKKHTTFKKENIICIASIVQLKKLTIQQFIDADVIIVNDRIYGSNAYRGRVSNFSGTLAHALHNSDASERAWRAWHESVVRNVRAFVPHLLNDPVRLREIIEDTCNHALKVARGLKMLIPSQRYSGSQYQKAKQAADKDAAEEKIAAKWRAENSVGYLKGARKTNTKKGKKKGPQMDHAAIGEGAQDANTLANGPVEDKSSAKLEIVEEGGVEAFLRQFQYRDQFDLDNLGGLDGWKNLKGPILEMFAPARLVVDEYHYHKETSLIFSLLQAIGEKAKTRLLLSATPKLGGFGHVKTLAKLLQVNLGADDYRSMPNDLFMAKTKDLTAREKLMVSGERLSNGLLHRRHCHSQNFLDVFCGRGEAPPIPNERVDKLLPVSLPAVEFFQYNVAQQEIENYQMENLQENQDPVGELLQKASIPEYKDCEKVYQDNFKALATIERDLLDQLTKTMHLQKLCNEDWDDSTEDWKDEWLNRGNDWVRMALAGTMADPDCDQKIRELIELVGLFVEDHIFSTHDIFGKKEGMLSGKKKSAQHSHLPEKVASLSDIVAGLNDLRIKFIDQLRLTRVSQTVMRVHSNDHLDCDGCSSEVRSNSLEVLGKCGHLFCHKCLEFVEKDNQCIVGNCFATARSYQLMSGSDLVQKPFEPSEGAKATAILELLQRITDRNEKAIIFAQDLQFLTFLGPKLKKQDIKYTHLHIMKDEQKATALMAFAKDDKTSTVLLLNIGDSSAAGSNLTIANHVIFVAPYHVEGSDGQRDYDAAMKQSIGRALRMGQKTNRPVHVYQFFAKKTVDADLLEHRNSMILKGVGVVDNVEVAAFVDKSWGKGDYTSPCAEMLCRPDDEYA